MTASDLARGAVKKLVAEHHDAFMVELFGPDAALSPDRLEALIVSGALDPEDIERVLVPGSAHDLDPWLFLKLASRIVSEAPGKRAEMRDWSLPQWVAAVDARVDKMLGGVVEEPTGFTIMTQADKPEPPPAYIPVRPETPDYLPRAEAHAYSQAISRAGAYARGLGNIVSSTLDTALTEAWSGEDIVAEVDPQKRARTLETIRDQTAEAIATHRDSGKLARDLADATQDFAHNWEMIARTELQGSYNDGQILAAIEDYGPEALIARYPETGACADCRRLFVGPDGRPKIFPVDELLANGTNVGRRRAAWAPTIWPVHPNCRCDTVVVPPGYFLTKDGRLRPAREEE